MPQAFLFGGNSVRFMDEVHLMRSFLKMEAGVKIKKEIGTAYVGEGMAAAYLGLAIAQKTKDPLLILFSGHGGKLGWAFDDDRTLYYNELAKLLTVGKRPVAIINDCCHAMALVEHLEKAKVSPERVGVIAACEADATTCAGLIDQIIHIWRQRKVHPSGPKTRWGAELDAHFFAKLPVPP